MIHFYHVTKRFDAYSTALHDITFQIEKGEFVFLTGASGAGKSTLLKLILRQIRPTEGQIVVNGRNLHSMKRSQLPFFRREIGMVFQDFNLIERMTVFENLSFTLTVLGVPPREHKKRAYGALRAVSLHHKLNAYPLQLSGGEQQRIAIARALINEPLVIVADEPTGNLDPDLTQEIVQIFAEANLRGSTVLIATHDRELIEQSGRRVITLDHGRITDEKVAAHHDFAGRRFVSKEVALTRFRTYFANLSDVVGQLDENPFPASFECEIAPAVAQSPAFAQQAKELRAISGIDEVQFDWEWVEKLKKLINLVNLAGIIAGGILAIAAAFTIANVTRLTMLLYREEIDIMRLVGATERMIRGPFLIEGVLQGFIGAAAAIALLFAAFLAGRHFLAPRYSLLWSFLFNGFLPWRKLLALLAGGTLAGYLGSWLSVRESGEERA